MKKLFKYLRRQPKPVRDQYALLFSGVFILLVAAFWLPAQFGNNEPEKVVEVTEEKEFPFKTFLKTIKDQFASVVKTELTESEIINQEESENTEVYQGSVDDFVLPEEEVAALKQKLEETETNLVIPESGSYQEVLIATTSATSSLEAEAE